MVKRRYLITFRFNAVNEDKFTVVYGDNKYIAYAQACTTYGFYNIGGVYVNNAQNREYLHAKGKTEM